MSEKIYSKEELDAETQKAVAAALAGAHAQTLETMIPKAEHEKLVSAARLSVIEEMKQEQLADEIVKLRAAASLSVIEKPELLKKASAALAQDKALIEEMMDKIPALKEVAAAKFRNATLPGNATTASSEMKAALDKLHNKYKGT